MGVKAYDHQLITGLSNSGVTDGSGAWNVGVNLSLQLAAMPANAKGVVIKTINLISSAQWAGIRVNGEATTEFQLDFTGIAYRIDFIPLFGNTLIDLYRESANIEFRVLWVLDQTWTMFPVNSRPSLASSAGAFTTRTVIECPENSAVITGGHRWRPTGESTNITNVPSGQQLIKLDAAKQYTAATTTTVPVIGYTVGSVDWRPWLTETLTYTADSTWRAAANEYAGKRALHLVVDKTGTSLDIDFRASGSAYAAGAGNAPDENCFTDLNSSGQFDYLAETTLAAPVYIVASLPDVEVLTVTISAINQARTGQASRIDFNAAFASTTVSITGDTITKNITPSVVDADSVDALVPAWVDGETCVKIGPVTFTATDGVTTTDQFNDDLEFWSAEADDPIAFQFTPIEILSLATGNLSAAFGLTPAWQVGTQVIFNSARALIGVDGVYGGNHTGESYIWYRNPDDKIARRLTITTQDGEVISVNGLTARGLTAVGLTATGLTAVGL